MTLVRPLRFLTTFVALCLLATLAMADTVADGAQPTDQVRGDCQVGNLNEPVGEGVPEFFTATETFAYRIFPADQCQCADGGFALEAVNQLLYFEHQRPDFVFQATALLLSAEWDASTDCWLPGEILEESQPQTFRVVSAGLYEVRVPGTMANFYPLDANYFIALRYEGDAIGDIMIDADPQPCVEYIDRGNGWQDLFDRDKNAGGKIILWGDIVCGVPTVPADGQTWGSIKALYK